MPKAKAPVAAYRPGSSLVFGHWPAPLHSSLTMHLHAPSLTLVNGLHFHVPMRRPRNHGSWHPGSLQLRVCLYVALVLVAHISPHPKCVWNWPLLLHRHLQLAPTAECVQTTSSSHHHFLSWSLANGPGDNTEDHNSPCSHCRSSAVLAKDHIVVNAVDPRNLSWRNITSLWTWCHYVLSQLVPCTTRHRVTAYPSMLYL